MMAPVTRSIMEKVNHPSSSYPRLYFLKSIIGNFHSTFLMLCMLYKMMRELSFLHPSILTQQHITTKLKQMRKLTKCCKRLPSLYSSPSFFSLKSLYPLFIYIMYIETQYQTHYLCNIRLCLICRAMKREAVEVHFHQGKIV